MMPKIKYIFIAIIFLISFFNVNIFYAKAVVAVGALIQVEDGLDRKQAEAAEAARKKDEGIKKIWHQKIWPAILKGGSKGFWAATRSALNTIAYDTATWIGSGGKGQKPLFITEGWDKYLSNIKDNAAGTFLEKLGSENGYLKFNLCEPNLAVKIKIGLGLTQYERPGAPTCTFSVMAKNWEKELQRVDFLKRFQTMFDPVANDVGIALSLQTGITEEKELASNMKELDRKETGGWLDFESSLDGLRKGKPKQAELEAELAQRSNYDKLALYTGDTFIDASNIFLNQLAITAFNKLLRDLAKDSGSYTSPYSGNYGLSDVNAQRSLGASGLKDKLRKLVEPSFKTRGDYDILAELSFCPDPSKAGPTNCVITEKFRQAISEKKTVATAIQEGHLNAAGIFGFAAGSLELSYMDENYPYRSMIILRKYRILPVGWELAAQYIKENSSVGTKNLGDLVACFDPSDKYDGYSENWCRGLVDPDWVLKAPFNYCKREGAGPEIISQQILGEQEGSKLFIGRNTNYCADEQSCIRENNDGSCQAYGYCTEEKRKWNSGADSCEPRNNTCQTFRADNGSTASYLENTLDYTGCSVDNAGCNAYSLTGAYATTSSSVQWSAFRLAYFDKNVKTCSKDGEGCHELIRINSGANLFINPSFENTLVGTFWDGMTATTSEAFDGAKSLEISADFSKDFELGTSGYSVGGNPFAFSFFAKDCGFAGEIKLGNATSSLVTSNVWNRYSVSYLFPASVLGNTVPISISNVSADCKIDAVKLELGESASDYNDYRDSGIIYQKMLPGYLEDTCYENPGIDYSLKDNVPSICNDFSRQCNASEEGCEMYTSVSDGTNIPAKTVAQDYCPSECVGFDTYIQSESAFDSLRDSYFIPRTAKSCSAEAVGCDQFTNLDKVSKGGEGTEHYSYLRQCIKPDANQCSDFYTWEGSDETGFQLKVVKLKKDGLNPAVSGDDSLECSEMIYNLPPTDPSYNPDCREFYNKNGAISHHLMSYTISCSDNCYPFRRTEVNTDPQITDSADCGALCSDVSSDGDGECWDDKDDTDPVNDECVVCKNGGTWDSQARACIYMAVPEEGTQCAANNNGCREYSGNTGNNVRIVLNNDFEGSVQGWEGGSLSNEALMAGGNSLYISGVSAVASTTVGHLVGEGKSYNLKFLAKPSANNGFSEINSISLINGSGDSAAFMASLARKSDGWQIYEINLTKLDHPIDDAERLEIKTDGSIFIDNLRLTEISDRYYLIKGSWNTPDSCNQDTYGNPYTLYMLGCDAYNDRDNRTHYLHSFSNLCQESAVGCELMIDTQNSNSYAENPTYSIPADKYIYAVYDKSKQCGANDKGCSLMGESYQYDGSTIFSDVYLKNDPDDYDKITCASADVGCKEWSTDAGVSYFKDPGDQICEWRQKEGEAGYDWFRKKIKRCDTNNDGVGDGSVCLSDKNCSGGWKCQMENSDTVCSTSNLKTFGYGGRSVYQPDAWAGLCSASEAGCTELIDPISKSSSNIIFNADFSQDVDNNGPDGWSGNIQEVDLEPNTLYVLAVENNTISVLDGNFRELDSANNLGVSVASIDASSTGSRVSKRFYTSDATVSATIRAAGITGRVELKRAIIDYVLDKGFDKASCNGLVNFEDGCVLFNERAQNGSGLSSLIFNADLTIDDKNGVSSQSDINNNANKLIKVVPDRVCDKWLACKEIVQTSTSTEVVCGKIGICDKFDKDGNCDRFIDSATSLNRTYPTNLNYSQISNMSGYVKAGHEGADINRDRKINPYPDDYYQFENMTNIGFAASVPNYSFEDIIERSGSADPNDADIPNGGWICSNGGNDCETIDDPVEAQNEGNICYKQEGGNCLMYAPDGGSFLKINSAYGNEGEVRTRDGEEISVEKSSEYILTAYLNTLRLSSGQVSISVQEFRKDPDSGNLLDNGTVNVINFNNNQDWSTNLGRFTTKANTAAVKIFIKVVKVNNIAEGYAYVDKIRIRPALQSRSDWKIMQSCRLYPNADSLSCDYFDDSGVRNKGWEGYCLEYDREPGDPDACLLWWPVPPATDRVNDWCGDGIVNGGEDCDCAKNLDGTPNYNCSAPFNGGQDPYWKFSPYGTNRSNQYRCLNCIWTDGWCGDNVVEMSYNEHCDFNELNSALPNLNSQSCSSNPNNYGEYSHNGYNDYLYGSLGCNNISNINNKCIFNVSGCSDNLVGGVHTRRNCIDAGGVVINKDGVMVTDSAGMINNPNVGDTYKEFFCKFTGSSCAAGWTQYGNWSTASDNSCTNEDSNWTGCSCSVTVNVTGHTWSDKAPQSKEENKCACGGCSSCEARCTATAIITEIGCY